MASGSEPGARPSQHQHDGKATRVLAPPVDGQVSLAVVLCQNGMAGEYPCRNVDLMAHMPLNTIGGGNGNDIWGWTDPQTSREYALVGRTSGTAFVDVTTPSAPVYLGNLPTATVNSSWRDIEVANNHAYIVSEASGHGLQVFNLTRLRGVANPPVTFTADARNTSFGSAHTVTVNPQTGFAYVNGSTTCSGGPRMFNLASPANPTFAGCVSADGYTHDAQAAVYQGPDTRYQGREILLASNEDTLTIWDVTTKASPVRLSRTTYAGRGYTHQGWLTNDHRYFFLNDELDEQRLGHNTRTRVFSMASLTSPALLGFYDGPTRAIDHQLFIKGRFVYESNYTAGLRIIDTTNAANPSTMTEAAFFDVHPANNNTTFNGTWANYPFFNSGTVVVNSIERGLFVLRPNLGAPPNPPVTVFSDNFETSQGWTTNAGGTDTATSGAWERGDPEATSSGVALQLGTTTSGVNDLVTARLAGAGAGANDVDGGVTTIRSPAITLPATGTLTLSLRWYLAHLTNSSNTDFFRVRVIGSTTSTVFEQLGAATNRAGSWGTASANLGAFAGQTIRVQIEAGDAGTASLVEAGVDDVTITQQT